MNRNFPNRAHAAGPSADALRGRGSQLHKNLAAAEAEAPAETDGDKDTE